MENVMTESREDALRRMYKENNLIKEDVFKHKHFVIITRSGIEKIMENKGITIQYDPIKMEQQFVVIKAVASLNGKTVETFGEASPRNTSNSYLVAIAEKRALSRAVLKLAGYYQHGVFSEDESDDFKRK